ncbi:MAG: PQQ-dependent sugar dehydrogenase [Algiphilus sp.]|uniref:PQQ-dependent sugar dehydrogenase n=1 Tax=Algiphilus sp. TaxID=1872431 RepID=UPI0032EAD8FE
MATARISTLTRFRLALCLLCVAPLTMAAEDYRIDTLAEGLDHPWSLAFIGDGRMLITEKAGRLFLLDAQGQRLARVEGVPAVFDKSQGGLFEVLPAPDFADSGMLYLSYAHGDAQANATRLLRARLQGDRLVEGEVIFTAEPTKDTPVHYGGRMCWRGDGTLMLGLGDGFDYREAAQALDSHLGTLVRLNPDGSIPQDNPFVGRAGSLAAIYSYGHRNVQGLYCDGDAVWAHEHGPRGGDELNRIEPGGNYGWPVATHGIDYSGARISPYTEIEGMRDPMVHWTPSIGPSALTRYAGERFPDWQGDFFVATLVEPGARRLQMRDGAVVAQQRLFEALGTRIRDIRSGPDGALYVLTDGADAALHRILPAD